MNNILLIFKKEFLELRRDKRTFYSAILGPVFLIYLMLTSLSFVEKSFSGAKSQRLHVVRSVEENPFVESLRKVPEIQIISVDSVEAGRKLIEKGDARVLLTGGSKAEGAPIELTAIFDPDELKAKVLLGMLSETVDKTNDARVTQLLDAANVSKADREPIHLNKEPISKKPQTGGDTLAGFLPYLIVIWAFYGAFGNASESVAAEKEKQTLETLLIAPVKRREVALGKFLTLFSISLTSCLVSILTISILGPTIASKSMFPGGFHISAAATITSIAAIVPLSAMFAGLLLAVSAYARNARECQTFLTLLSFVVLIPAVFSQFIGFTDFAHARWVSFVPVLNAATVLRQALLDKIDPTGVVITILVSSVLAFLGVWLAVRMFEREKILVRV